MSYRKACEALRAAWDDVSAKWSAEAKSQYFSKRYLPLLDEAEGMYRRSDDLEDYAEHCLQSLRR